MINSKKHVCWNITPRCNANCNFCHRMNNIQELSLVQNNLVLERLIAGGIDRITWTGGEALLYRDLEILMKKAKMHGITNQLITNGKAFTQERIDRLAPMLTTITLSLDSCDSLTNAKMGRGGDQYQRVSDILEYLHGKYPYVKIKVNTVACKMNLESFDELITFIDTHAVNRWKIFRFMDLRGDSITNKDLFWITDSDFADIKKKVSGTIRRESLSYSFADIDTIESEYLLVRADGEVIITRNKADVELGNLQTNELSNLLRIA